MDVVALPILRPGTRLRAAVEAMHAAKRSAVLRRDGARLTLVTAGDVVLAIDADKGTLADVAGGRSVHAVRLRSQGRGLERLAGRRGAAYARGVFPATLAKGLAKLGATAPASTLHRASPRAAGPAGEGGRFVRGRRVSAIVTIPSDMARLVQQAPRDCYCVQFPNLVHEFHVRPPQCAEHRCRVVCIS
jgi:hypothetical protein